MGKRFGSLFCRYLLPKIFEWFKDEFKDENGKGKNYQNPHAE